MVTPTEQPVLHLDFHESASTLSVYGGYGGGDVIGGGGGGGSGDAAHPSQPEHASHEHLSLHADRTPCSLLCSAHHASHRAPAAAASLIA